MPKVTSLRCTVKEINWSIQGQVEALATGPNESNEVSRKKGGSVAETERGIDRKIGAVYSVGLTPLAPVTTLALTVNPKPLSSLPG